MATIRTTPPVATVADPSVFRQESARIQAEQQISSTRTTVAGPDEVIYSQAVANTSATDVIVTQSVNNSSGDVVTVYSTQGGINVTAVDQTVNQYTVSDSGVSQIIGGTGIIVSSTGPSGTGVVTVSSNTTFGNITSVNLDGNISNVLRGDGTWGADANSSYGNSNVASYLPTYTGNISGDYLVLTHDVNANVVQANYLYGNGSNITNLPVGNIANINLDGNASNVLRGDGTFGPDANSSYGDSNVTSLLGAFGSNTITTTGLITGDGGGLSNVPYANVTGTPSLGNISSLNLDGNASNLLSGAGTYVAIPVVPTVGNVAPLNLDGNVSNVLRGDGTWAPDAAGTYGDSNVTSLLGAFGSNTIVTTGIITADGANLSNVPYANLTGAPSLGNISSLNLDGNASNLLSGAGTYVAIPTVPTVGNIATLNLDGNSQTWLAGNGVFANIAIPSVGNIAVINLDGNASNVLRGDGTFSADANSAYGDSNVTSLLGAFGSNTIVTTGIITADGANLSNVPYANLTGAPTLGNISSVNLDGNVSNVLTGNGTFVALPVINANTVVWSTAPVANTSNGAAGQAAYDSGGNLYVCVATDTWAKFTGATSW